MRRAARTSSPISRISSNLSGVLEPHAPHETIHSWKSFAIHHRHQRSELEAQMHEVLQADIRLDDADFQQLKSLRAYLLELRAAIVAKLHAKDGAPQPSCIPNDPGSRYQTPRPRERGPRHISRR